MGIRNRQRHPRLPRGERPASRVAWRLGAAGMLGMAMALAACSSGSSSSAPSGARKPAVLAKDASGTIQEWNWDIAADDPGEHAVIPMLIKMMKQQYPHLTIVNTSMTLGEQNDKLPLAFASSGSAPTISQTNEGLENQGRLVKDGELLPLNAYDKIYHWFPKVVTLPLALNSSPSGSRLLP